MSDGSNPTEMLAFYDQTTPAFQESQRVSIPRILQ